MSRVPKRVTRRTGKRETFREVNELRKISFDGEDDIIPIPTGSGIPNLSSGFTICVLSMHRSVKDGDADRDISLYENNFAILHDGGGGRFTFRVRDTGGTNHDLTHTIENHRWNFWCAWYDGSDMKLYKNLELVAGPTACPDVNNYGNQDGIGYQPPGGPVKWFDGEIAFVLVYTKALTLHEMEDVLYSFDDPPRTELEAWWPMEKGTGTTVEDKTGNGHDGDMNNFTSPHGWRETKGGRVPSVI